MPQLSKELEGWNVPQGHDARAGRTSTAILLVLFPINLRSRIVPPAKSVEVTNMYGLINLVIFLLIAMTVGVAAQGTQQSINSPLRFPTQAAPIGTPGAPVATPDNRGQVVPPPLQPVLPWASPYTQQRNTNVPLRGPQ
jgi:hypothetical protein